MTFEFFKNCEAHKLRDLTLAGRRSGCNGSLGNLLVQNTRRCAWSVCTRFKVHQATVTLKILGQRDVYISPIFPLFYAVKWPCKKISLFLFVKGEISSKLKWKIIAWSDFTCSRFWGYFPLNSEWWKQNNTTRKRKTKPKRNWTDNREKQFFSNCNSCLSYCLVLYY